MNKRIKRLWIKALRSGRYKQCRSQLRKKQHGAVFHCCLGVLEEIRVKETGSRFKRGRGNSCNLLSKETWQWAGLDCNDPVLQPKNQKTAAELNDDGKSFNYIADRIEKYL